MPNQEEEAGAHPLIYQKPDRLLEEKDKSRNRILQSVEDSQSHYKPGERSEADDHQPPRVRQFPVVGL